MSSVFHKSHRASVAGAASPTSANGSPVDDVWFPCSAGRPHLAALRAKECVRYWEQAVAKWAFRSAAARVFELNSLAVGQGADGGEGLPEEYSFRLAEGEDLAVCAAMAGTPLEQYQRRRDRGDRCYAVFLGHRAVNLSWLHFGPCYVRGLGWLVEATPSECYLYNVVTAPSHRGKGLYKRTQRRLVDILGAQGVTRIRQVVMVGNTIPLASLPKLGYTLTEEVRHLFLGGLHVTTAYDATGKRLWRRWFCRQPTTVCWI